MKSLMQWGQTLEQTNRENTLKDRTKARKVNTKIQIHTKPAETEREGKRTFLQKYG